MSPCIWDWGVSPFWMLTVDFCGRNLVDWEAHPPLHTTGPFTTPQNANKKEGGIQITLKHWVTSFQRTIHQKNELKTSKHWEISHTLRPLRERILSTTTWPAMACPETQAVSPHLHFSEALPSSLDTNCIILPSCNSIFYTSPWTIHISYRKVISKFKVVSLAYWECDENWISLHACLHHLSWHAHISPFNPFSSISTILGLFFGDTSGKREINARRNEGEQHQEHQHQQHQY